MPEAPQAVRSLADTMIAKFTPPSFVPGCEVKSVADISEYTTDNGWIEAVVGGDNQQRVRYYGTPQGVIVGDFVDVEYFPAYKLYRVFGSTLGGTAIVGGLRVNKVWASDFSSESLVTDASDNVTINTGTLTLPSDIVHLGDPDTLLSFADDKFSVTTGGLVAFQVTETAQDLVEIGDVADTGDWDIDFNSGQVNIKGSNGFFGIGVPNPLGNFHLAKEAASTDTQIDVAVIDRKTTGTAEDGIGSSFSFRLPDDAGTLSAVGKIGAIFTTVATATRAGGFTITATAVGGGLQEVARFVSGQKVGLAGVDPSTRLDIGAGAMEFDEMTAPGAGAVNTTRFYAEDSGGTTRQQIVFNGGHTVTIAQDGGLQTYTPTNVVTDRSYDANATSVAELADVLGTLIADFQAAGVLG